MYTQYKYLQLCSSQILLCRGVNYQTETQSLNLVGNILYLIVKLDCNRMENEPVYRLCTVEIVPGPWEAMTRVLPHLCRSISRYGKMSLSLMSSQMTRVISSPFISTTEPALIFWDMVKPDGRHNMSIIVSGKENLWRRCNKCKFSSELDGYWLATWTHQCLVELKDGSK